MKIFKYPIEVVDQQRVRMPRGAKILTAQVQDGAICLWALVDPDESLSEKVIGVYGTGNPLPDFMAHAFYIATVQLFDGKLVFHVFEHILGYDVAWREVE